MPAQAVKMPDWMQFREVIKNRGHDFWVSCLANVTVDDMLGKVDSLRIEGELASDIFSHCYVKAAVDIKAVANAVFDEFGLGLRKKRVLSSSAPGVVFAFVNNDGPSILSKWRESMGNNDKRLSAEERLRREQHIFRNATLADMDREMGKNKHRFWLTSVTGVDVETCKKRVVTSSIEGQLAVDRFKCCLVAEVSDCLRATDQLTSRHGMGLRKSMVRAKAGQGCLALLYNSTEILLAGARATEEANPKRTEREDATPLPDAKRRHVSVADQLQNTAKSSTDKSMRLATSASKESTSRLGSATSMASDASVSVTLPLQQKQEKDQRGAPAATAAPQPKAILDAASPGKKPDKALPSGPPPDPAGDLHYRQVQVLEGKMAKLLPTLKREKFATDYIQGKLELIMQKPKGRLDKFKLDIGRIWRAWLDDRLAEDVF
eukprot:TRINITY_DN6643_c0_g1_i1.p1 TRINITY_DN6643_c0_g1~~TRINITY_DN6643_c0_g1_i1.p1  ORF type:complete len:434 (+),score=78.67 TRINITY_DN6643_c0_g1_i1:77-1378(+)